MFPKVAVAERTEDIGPLAEALIARHRQRLGIREAVTLSDEALQHLKQYAWRGMSENLKMLFNEP